MTGFCGDDESSGSVRTQNLLRVTYRLFIEDTH